AYSYCKNQDDALDMVQEAGLSAWQAIPALENMEYLKTWFYRILINKSLTHLQKAKRLPILADDDLMSRQAYPDNADNRESIYDLYGGLDLLPPKLRTVIFLRYFEDMKLKDISLVLQEPESTVKSRLYKALTALREIMENDKGGLANE
ncbi:MAG: sigma-70 family RNA polymerase sigma factor, partial [Clostridiales bacterium]